MRTTNSVNSIGIYLRTLKAIYNRAVKRGLVIGAGIGGLTAAFAVCAALLRARPEIAAANCDTSPAKTLACGAL